MYHTWAWIGIIVIVFLLWWMFIHKSNGAIAPRRHPYSIFAASLGGEQEVPPVSTMANGRAVGYLTQEDTSFRYEVTFSGLAPTGAHIHRGAPGETGPIVKNLIIQTVQTAQTANGPVYKCVGIWNVKEDIEPLTSTLAQDLKAGLLYVNIHSQTHPDGEIRGQLTRSLM